MEKSSRGISYFREAVAGLEAERSVSGNFLFQERRSLGWRWKDPSQEFLIPRRGGHWVGGGKIRLGEFLIPWRGGRWAGGGKIRLGEFLISRRGGHWAGDGKIRLGNFLFPGLEVEGWRWKDASRGISYSQ